MTTHLFSVPVFSSVLFRCLVPTDCFLCLGFFSLEPFLQHLCLSSASFCSPRWLELFRLRDHSAQPHCRVIFIFNRTSSGQYSSGSVFVLSLSDSLLSELHTLYTTAPFQQCNRMILILKSPWSANFPHMSNFVHDDHE